jgi:hypothetical protein
MTFKPNNVSTYARSVLPTIQAVIQQNRPCLLIKAVCAGVGLLAGLSQAAAQGTAFSYQGSLSSNNSEANGNFDFTFSLFASSNGAPQVGVTLTNAAVGVTNGLFAATLDFGPGVFLGNPLWLQMGVRPESTGNFTLLSPLQPLLSAPYAVMAGGTSNLLGPLPSGGLAGSYSGAVSLNNSSNSFSGSGAGLTNLEGGSGSFGSGGATANGTNFTVNFNGPMYTMVLATNDVCFDLASGGPGAVTYVILPNGANRNILWNDNWHTLYTNGLSQSSTNFLCVLTNGQNFVISFLSPCNQSATNGCTNVFVGWNVTAQ